MIKNIYGYIYDIETGVLTSYPKAHIKLFIKNKDKRDFYLYSAKPGDKPVKTTYEEGEIHEYAGLCVVWYKEPNPIKAKADICQYLYKQAIEDEEKHKQEYEKAKKHTNELLSRLGLHRTD